MQIARKGDFVGLVVESAVGAKLREGVVSAQLKINDSRLREVMTLSLFKAKSNNFEANSTETG